MTADLDAARKGWSTLVAHAALKGFQLWRTDPDDGTQRFMIAKGGAVRVLADLAAVEHFLERAGAAK